MDIIDAFHLKNWLANGLPSEYLICSHDHQEIYSILLLTKHLLWIHKDFKVKPSFHALFSLCKCLHNLWKENNRWKCKKGSVRGHKRDVIITFKSIVWISERRAKKIVSFRKKKEKEKLNRIMVFYFRCFDSRKMCHSKAFSIIWKIKMLNWKIDEILNGYQQKRLTSQSFKFQTHLFTYISQVLFL